MKRGLEEGMPEIPGNLSTEYSGFCALERPGGTCLPITGSGAAFISGSSVGAENDILAYAVSAGMEPVIPPKKNRKEQRDYDKYLYKLLPGCIYRTESPVCTEY